MDYLVAEGMRRDLREGLAQVASVVAHRRPAAPSPAETVVAAELAAVRGELTRVDAKCGTLVGLAGAGLAFTLTAVSSKAPVGAAVLLVGAAVALAGSALVLLRALRPRFGSSGFCRWSDRTADQITQGLADVDPARHHAADLAVLSAIAVRKFRAIRRAVDLMAVGIVLLAAAIVAGVIW